MVHRKTLRAASLVLASAILAACAVGPDYREPPVNTPDQFVSVSATQSAGDLEQDFWKSFNDATLDELIEDALRANHDIRIAMTHLREARAIRGEARLDFAPTVNLASRYWARTYGKRIRRFCKRPMIFG